jgi:hypothetical protein
MPTIRGSGILTAVADGQTHPSMVRSIMPSTVKYFDGEPDSRTHQLLEALSR